MQVVYYHSHGKRSKVVGEAVVKGLSKLGIKTDVRSQTQYVRPDYDVAIHYGLIGNLKKIQKDYTSGGRVDVLLDLGYWGRVDGGRLSGYHRIAVNALHGIPSVNLNSTSDRFDKFNIPLKKFKNVRGSNILLCGQSAKASWVYDMNPEQWERRAIKELRKYTDRPIVYHPKLSWPDGRHIEGTVYNRNSVETIFPNTWALVSHHSNASLHALAEGLPIHVDDGITKSMSFGVENIENLSEFDVGERNQLLYDAAYCQWNMEEISLGKPFKFLREVGVL